MLQRKRRGYRALQERRFAQRDGLFIIDRDFDNYSVALTPGELRGYALNWFPAYAGNNKPINHH